MLEQEQEPELVTAPECENENTQGNEESSEKEAPVLEIVENYPFLPQFEFDAPRYKNFCLKKWRETRRILNKMVLKIDESDDDDEEEDKEEDDDDQSAITLNDGVTEEFSFLMNFEDAERLFSKSVVDEGETDYEELDAWFNRFHPLHEPLRPMTPPGPLLSPERSTTQHRPLRSFAISASPQPRPSSPVASPTRSSMTVNSPLRPVGASSPLKQPLLSSPKYSPKHSPLSSPVKMRLLSSPVRNFSPLTRIPPLTSSPTRSPLTAAPLAVAPVKMGLKAKATRVLKPESHESSPVEIKGTREIAEVEGKEIEEAKARVFEEVIKSVEHDEPSKLKRSHSETQTDSSKRSKLKSAAKVDLDDIKKLLNQHNNRIRPHNNKR